MSRLAGFLLISLMLLVVPSYSQDVKPRNRVAWEPLEPDFTIPRKDDRFQDKIRFAGNPPWIWRTETPNGWLVYTNDVNNSIIQVEDEDHEWEKQ